MFGYEIVMEKESEKNFKILEKHDTEALLILIEKTTQVALWITERLL